MWFSSNFFTGSSSNTEMLCKNWRILQSIRERSDLYNGISGFWFRNFLQSSMFLKLRFLLKMVITQKWKKISKNCSPFFRPDLSLNDCNLIQCFHGTSWKKGVRDHKTHIFHSKQTKVKFNNKHIYTIVIPILLAFTKCIILKLHIWRLNLVRYSQFCEHWIQGSPDTLNQPQHLMRKTQLLPFLRVEL